MFVVVIGYNDTHYQRLNERLTSLNINFQYERPCLHSVASLATAIYQNGNRVDSVHSLLDEQKNASDLCQQADVIILLVENCPNIKTLCRIVQNIRLIGTRALVMMTGVLLTTVFQHATGQEIGKIAAYIGADILIPEVHYEQTVLEILKAFERNTSLNDIQNIIFRDSSGYHITKPGQGYPFRPTGYVNWKLMNHIGREVQINTSWSCPFRCTHCFYPGMMGRYRMYDIDEIIRQLDYIALHTNVNLVCFCDRYLDVPHNRFRDLLNRMTQKKYPFRWYSFVHADHLDASIIKAMAESGCLGVAISLDSADPRILSIMRKRINLQHLVMINRQIQDQGMLTHTLFIVGTPGETMDSYHRTLSYINESLRPDFCLGRPWFCHKDAPIMTETNLYEISGIYNDWHHKTMDYKTAAQLCSEHRRTISGSHLTRLSLPQTFQLYASGMTRDQIKYINKNI